MVTREMEELMRMAQSVKGAELTAETMHITRQIAQKYDGTTEDDFDVVKLMTLLMGPVCLLAITAAGIEMKLDEIEKLLRRFAPPTGSGT